MSVSPGQLDAFFRSQNGHVQNPLCGSSESLRDFEKLDLVNRVLAEHKQQLSDFTSVQRLVYWVQLQLNELPGGNVRVWKCARCADQHSDAGPCQCAKCNRWMTQTSPPARHFYHPVTLTRVTLREYLLYYARV